MVTLIESALEKATEHWNEKNDKNREQMQAMLQIQHERLQLEKERLEFEREKAGLPVKRSKRKAKTGMFLCSNPCINVFTQHVMLSHSSTNSSPTS